jgi:hypothetical protein
MNIGAWGVSGAGFWSLGCCWRVLWMLGVDFNEFRDHFGVHFESNFVPQRYYFSSYFLSGCWMWFWTVFHQIRGLFWFVSEQECGLQWNMWDYEKPMFYVVISMISRLLGIFVDLESVENTLDIQIGFWIGCLLFFLWFWDHFGVHFTAEFYVKTIWNLDTKVVAFSGAASSRGGGAVLLRPTPPGLSVLDVLLRK